VRLSPSLFKGAGTSVSRLAINSLDSHWDLFREHVQKPPLRVLECIGQIKVEKLQEIGSAYEFPVSLTVEAKPEQWNLGHAEVTQNITKGLSRKIGDALILHQRPAS